MKLKLNFIQLLALGMLASPVFFTSCSEDQLDEVNKNVNNPLDVQAKFLLSEVLTSTAFSTTGGDISTYASTYIEHEVGTYNQLWNAEHRVNEPSLASTFNNPWGSTYTTLKNAKIIISKCSEDGTQAGNYTTLGMGQVLAAYNLAKLTDMFGDIPYSEAMDIDKTLTPNLDKQEVIYKEILSFLDQAIENLPKGDKHASGSPAKYDLLFNGDAAKWVKFANGLKARYTMRLLKVSANQNQALQDVIKYVDASFQSATEQAAFNVYGPSNLNPLFDFQWSRDGLAASKSLADKMIVRNDPRLTRNFTTAKLKQVAAMTPGDTDYLLLAPNGENDQTQYHYLTSTFVYSQTASTQLLSFHELLFLKAEALQRLGRSTSEIEPILKSAIVAAFVNSEKSVEAAFIAPTVLANQMKVVETSADLTSADADAYFTSSVKPLFEANPMKEIAVQKYLAFFGASGESPEMYNDIRRWKALGEDLIELKNPNKFPVRLPYGNDDTTTNPYVKAAYGDGQYVYTENVWWAGGTR